MTTVLLAPDKFKGSLSAAEVASALARGIRSTAPGVDVVTLPVSDGGEGTLDAALAAGYRRIPVTVTGPSGDMVATAYARRDDTAIIEMADACGLGRLPAGLRSAMTTTSTGLGQVIAAALDAGVREMVIGIGGSASTDGGAGMLGALGARILDRLGHPISAGGGGLLNVARLDLDRLHPALSEADITLACDVDNPLTGPKGAAVVYAPQKGADPREVIALDQALTHWSDIVATATGIDQRDEPGAGAAGGVGFAAAAILKARLKPGIALMLEHLHFAEQLVGVDLVITGEGSLDEQSLHGKAPIGVARVAGSANVPVVAVCGRQAIDDAVLRCAGVLTAYALTDLEPDLKTCMTDAERLLERTGEQLGRLSLLAQRT